MSLDNAPCKNLSTKEKEWFHAETPANAKKFCRRHCPEAVRQACLDKALKNEVPGRGRHGVWGGLSVNERNGLFGKVAA